MPDALSHIFTAPDVIIALGLFALVIVISGAAVRGLRHAGDWLIGHRRFGWLSTLWFSAGSGHGRDPAVPASQTAVESGPAMFWWQLMNLPALPAIWLVSPLIRRLRLVTAAQFFELRFDAATGALYCLYVAAMSTTLTAATFFGTGQVVHAFLGKSFDAATAEWNLAVPVLADPPSQSDLMESGGNPSEITTADGTGWEAGNEVKRAPVYFFGLLTMRPLQGYEVPVVALMILTAAALIPGGMNSLVRCSWLFGGMSGAILLVLFFRPPSAQPVGDQPSGAGGVTPTEVVPSLDESGSVSNPAEAGPGADVVEGTSGSSAEHPISEEGSIAPRGASGIAGPSRGTSGASGGSLFDLAALSLSLVAGCLVPPQIFAACSLTRDESSSQIGVTGGLLIRRAVNCVLLLAVLAFLARSGQAAFQATANIQGASPFAAAAMRAGTVIRELPPGVTGLFVAGLLGAAVGLVGVQVLAAGSLIAENLYRQYLHPAASMGWMLAVTRISAALVILAAFFLQTTYQDATHALNALITLPAVIGMNIWIGLFWVRWNSAAVWVSCLTSLVLWWLARVQPEMIADSVPAFLDRMFYSTADGPVMRLSWQTVMVLGSAFVAGLVTVRYSPEQPDEQLDVFYRLLRTPVDPREMDAPEDFSPLTDLRSEPPLEWRGIALFRPSTKGVIGFMLMTLFAVSGILLLKAWGPSPGNFF